VLDKDLKTRVTVRAGPHEIAVTFVKDGPSLLEGAGSLCNRTSTTGAIRERARHQSRFR
jgi:hypothetical protein